MSAEHRHTAQHFQVASLSVSSVFSSQASRAFESPAPFINRRHTAAEKKGGIPSFLFCEWNGVAARKNGTGAAALGNFRQK